MSQRLLVVDDDRSISEIMQMSLEEEGYIVDTAPRPPRRRSRRSAATPRTC